MCVKGFIPTLWKKNISLRCMESTLLLFDKMRVIEVDLQMVIRVQNKQLVVSLREVLHAEIRSLTMTSIPHIVFHHP